MPSISHLGKRMVQAYAPTCSGALRAKSSVSFIASPWVASSLVITTSSAAKTLTGLPSRSQPARHNTFTFRMVSTPASSSGGTDRLISRLVGWTAIRVLLQALGLSAVQGRIPAGDAAKDQRPAQAVLSKPTL